MEFRTLGPRSETTLMVEDIHGEFATAPVNRQYSPNDFKRLELERGLQSDGA
jgi:hypothetical protein